MDKRPAPQKIIAKDRESLLIKLEILLSEEKMMLTTLESERDVVEHDAQHTPCNTPFCQLLPGW